LESSASLEVFNILMRNGLNIEDSHRAKLEEYARLLLEWNGKINLISRKDTDRLWTAHLLHSLSLLLFVTPPQEGVIMDIGTGGGLPGIPIAIVRPDLKCILVDSIRKKAGAVEDMKNALGLGNVTVVNSRAEDLTAKSLGVKWVDGIVARAVAPIPDIMTWTEHLLNRNAAKPWRFKEGATSWEWAGRVLVMLKGGVLTEEEQKARLRNPAADIRTMPLVFNGSENIGLEEKKLVAVKF
jgi:16S rRNA (guanine527-N7)-methyltransferase